jgi:para-aminobenzoate synthetase/4-amino-4-deoxychorismate lyase
MRQTEPSTAQDSFVLLDDLGARREERRSRLYESPVEILSCRADESVEETLAAVAAATERGLHAAGWVSYEAGYALDPSLRKLARAPSNVPEVWFGLFADCRLMNHAEVTEWLDQRVPSGSDHFVSPMRPNISRDDYLAHIAAIKEYLRAGDTYQVNFTLKLRFTLFGDRLSLYRQLRRRQEAEFAAFLQTPVATVLSLSPELFFEQRGRRVTCRPMKGTIRRGLTAADDERNERFLTEDPKSRAENVMIVDLLRNDLGMVAATGSVRAEPLFQVERYRTLLQMTSTIKAQVPPACQQMDVLRSLFPCGSVTGAPKLRTMEIIRELELEERGIYTGSIGWCAPGGDGCFNVAIRTMVIDGDGNGELGIGSGIVYDSGPSDEFDESFLKARFMTGAQPRFSLIETLLWRANGGYWLLDHHLERLTSSIEFFNVPCDVAVVRTALQELIEQFEPPAVRVRVLVRRDGSLDFSHAPIPEAANGEPTPAVGVSPRRINSRNPFLYHKTTNRELYEQEWSRNWRERNWSETLFVNEAGLLTSACRGNLFLEVAGGRLLTPPIANGLLPGTLRRSLLASGHAVEAELRPHSLVEAQRILIGNSIRGLVEHRLPPGWNAGVRAEGGR